MPEMRATVGEMSDGEKPARVQRHRWACLAGCAAWGVGTYYGESADKPTNDEMSNAFEGRQMNNRVRVG